MNEEIDYQRLFQYKCEEYNKLKKMVEELNEDRDTLNKKLESVAWELQEAKENIATMERQMARMEGQIDAYQFCIAHG